MDLNQSIDNVREILNETFVLREQALKLSRETIRFCANSIRASHRREFDKARELLEEAKSRVFEVKEMLKDKPEIYFTGYVLDAQKEYGEAVLTNAIIRNVPLPNHTEIGIEPAVYLNSLAEAAGESRRYALDEMRNNNFDNVQRCLYVMDDIYCMLITVDFPDAISLGLKRHTDMVRNILEKTRSEITIIKHQNELKSSIDKLIEIQNK
ncbi:MAG: haloacid dehalogenase [Abditibacteriota bacterium]|nr:haloacid dehalogenase [Abditibacteriota bacterium]